MASSGTDAAEGDEGRSTAPSARATGWRVPSVDRTESAVPSAWFAPIATPIVAGPSPAASVGAGVADTDDGHTDDGHTDDGPKKRRRRWSLGRRRRDRAAGALDFPDPVDIDLVAMGLDDEGDHAWSELTVESLEDGSTDGAGNAGDDPWSLLAAEPIRNPRVDRAAPVGAADRVTELAAGETEAGALELETEFWVEGSDMAPGWLQRLKGREEHDDLVGDEPMEMLDLSAYDVPAERRGAFRDAVAAGTDAETDQAWAETTRELPD